MTFKIGIVGKPSSGKSTFLNAACLTDAKTAPHPFTTIKPNLGTAWLRAECPHAERPCKPRAGKCVDGIRLIPVPLVDVAGLVPGAHAGKGMGNQFLSDLADADALVHVVDASGRTDAEGQPTKGHDPAGDVRFLEDELDWWIAGIIKKDWAVTRRKAELKAFKLEAEVARQLSGLRVSPEQVEAAMKKIGFTTSADDSKILELAREVRVLSKPIVIAANKCDLPEARANVAKLPGAVPCSAEAEYALR
jgi:ribosome-binding ATPase YchF (GTP1/OBG family)